MSASLRRCGQHVRSTSFSLLRSHSRFIFLLWCCGCQNTCCQLRSVASAVRPVPAISVRRSHDSDLNGCYFSMPICSKNGYSAHGRPYCASMLRLHVAPPCCASMLRLHVAPPCCASMLRLVAPPCCASMLRRECGTVALIANPL